MSPYLNVSITKSIDTKNCSCPPIFSFGYFFLMLSLLNPYKLRFFFYCCHAILAFHFFSVWLTFLFIQKIPTSNTKKNNNTQSTRTWNSKLLRESVCTFFFLSFSLDWKFADCFDWSSRFFAMFFSFHFFYFFFFFFRNQAILFLIHEATITAATTIKTYARNKQFNKLHLCWLHTCLASFFHSVATLSSLSFFYLIWPKWFVSSFFILCTDNRFLAP